ncbi:hypothetical protein Aph01nite_34360 [Acrocarpospora phusangensis]|uniref:Uncharacterized protein n=1 Tax=Acrocarpospora phusangensis TaxID=1070424 RepID=A0A919UKK5_9ACTN|nr:hypothetical protein [Acrocarpospora phusangensis]GIH25126.1 hypothetical protein Aph01nite_34360 [Acrocarpospora phusangensis]
MKDLNENVYAIGIAAGSALTLELVGLYGFDAAVFSTDRSISAVLSEEEHEILYDAVQRIVALRLPPDDLAGVVCPPGACTREDCASPTCRGWGR